MNEREKLIELMTNSPFEHRTLGEVFYKHVIDKIADYLLENGVIVSPVKIGDTVYHCGYSFEIERIEISQDKIIYKCGNHGTDDYMAFFESDIGETVFLTKEEAEKALKCGAKMNERYLFRGKTTYDKWVEGDLLTFGGRCYIHPQNSDFEVKSGLARIVRVYKVIPETVGQCTGLKDKNGKLIFEGDILMFVNDDGEQTPYAVYWSNDFAGYVVMCQSGASDTMDCWDKYGSHYGIIGNIHDNPELLEAER